MAGLCFDKLDVEKGMEVRGPDGKTRRLKHPWSVLAYQIAGDAGLKLLHAEGKAEERETAPAENTLTDLLELPGKEGLSVLVLIDEVLMYAKEKVIQDRDWRGRLKNFFQYLTQAATKVQRCCIVASLLATDPKKTGDELGRQLLGDFADIFRRQREEAVEPVVKDDVAEVLRRRFFTPDSIKDTGAVRQHVIAALKGIAAVDEQTAKSGAAAEERLFRSYPFHPDLTEVLYAKWTQLRGFQRTRGVLRTFALALRRGGEVGRQPADRPGRIPERAGRRRICRTRCASWSRWPTPRNTRAARRHGPPIIVSELERAREIREGVGRAEVPRDRAGGRGDLPALAAGRPERPHPRPDGAGRPVPARQDRAGERAAPLGPGQPLARRHVRCPRGTSCPAPGGWATGRT